MCWRSISLCGPEIRVPLVALAKAQGRLDGRKNKDSVPNPLFHDRQVAPGVLAETTGGPRERGFGAELSFPQPSGRLSQHPILFHFDFAKVMPYPKPLEVCAVRKGSRSFAMESIRLQSFLKIGSGWGDRYVAGMSIRRRILFLPALSSPQLEPHRYLHPTDLIQLGSQEQEGRHNFREMLLC